MKPFSLSIALVLAACGAGPVAMPPPAATQPLSATQPALDPVVAARNFSAVVARVGPVAETECHRRLPDANCSFRIVVDTTPGAAANAFQHLQPDGRPVLAFTLALIAEARNADELAFVMGHEAAHHILDHIPRQERLAAISGKMSAVLAAALGGDPLAIEAAQTLGADLGGRSYSKDYELEADALGTLLAYRAGYDPERGAQFFARIPDPGNGFLGSHPPNAARLAVVRETMIRLRAGQF